MVATGTPEELAQWTPSYTGNYIKELLAERGRRSVQPEVKKLKYPAGGETRSAACKGRAGAAAGVAGTDRKARPGKVRQV